MVLQLTSWSDCSRISLLRGDKDSPWFEPFLRTTHTRQYGAHSWLPAEVNVVLQTHAVKLLAPKLGDVAAAIHMGSARGVLDLSGERDARSGARTICPVEPQQF